MKVLIVGAGIGGLCAALCLQKAGHEVKVFERLTEFVDTGAGIQLGANATRILQYLGLLSKLESLAVKPYGVFFRNYSSGEILYSAEFGDRYQEKFAAPYLHLHRADLHKTLLDALADPKDLRLGAKVIAYQEKKESVVLKVADGQCFEGDVLIGADGIRSKIKTQLLNDSEINNSAIKPQFTGNVAWRGIVTSNQLPADFMDAVVTNFVGPKKHMVIYYLRQQQLVNFVAVVQRDSQQDESWVTEAPWQELKSDFAGWHPTVQTVVDAMADQPCYRWALYDHKPLSNWSSERVTLLGDAAHATLPFLASGAAMAIEDARILQRSLDKKDSIAKALQSYQANRIKRTAKIQAMSKKVGSLYHIQNPTLQNMAFKVVKSKSKKTESFLGGYDANLVELI